MIEIKPVLLPFPKSLKLSDGSFTIKEGDFISVPVNGKEDTYNTALDLRNLIHKSLGISTCIIKKQQGQMLFKFDTSLAEQGYIMEVKQDSIEIYYSHTVGASYAVSTLKQLLLQYGRTLPCLSIEDEPDFKRRGIMLDISRNKIPTMETLYRLVDFMSDLKLNELQLYIEGFSFAYPSYPEVWKAGTPITPEEIRSLDSYCRERKIDLVPNQNSFGHMAPWLEREEFQHLAECPEGCMSPWGEVIRNTTLNPLDEGSIELIRSLYDDLLPNFTSEYFNAGLDEPFELGYGKSKEAVSKCGEGRIYLDYLLEVYKEVDSRGKKMMFWGDIITKHPEFIPELPENITALEWGYEAEHPFRENCEKYRNAGIEFYVCPGTSSWCSILGRTDNMKKNLLNAAENGLKYGAEGFLNTDWGDFGHIQYLPVSYASFCYGAAVSWNVQDNKHADLSAYLDKFVYKDKSGVMTDLTLKLGNYYLYEREKRTNGTRTFDVLNSKLEGSSEEKLSCAGNCSELENYLVSLKQELQDVRMNCDDADLILNEYENGIRYVLHGVERVKYLLDNSGDAKELIKGLLEDIDLIIKSHRELWLKRNRMGGLEQSVGYMLKLRDEYIKMI